ncbi:hypothetical protein BLNAU_13791 [Blattamonas nauphoetae]|uniref:Uncharacterized protein n=1 Tax=Blattamonas nauphoetae TaxID=2049346 RepID=A0ABQ9XHX2_9EUKA|nr:hypothetical protein BLNAU_13791 [Blattamonas nauphoetae]
MHQRFLDIEDSDQPHWHSNAEGGECESDAHPIRLRSSRRNGLYRHNDIDSPRQNIFHPLFELSTSLKQEDESSLLSTLSSIRLMSESCDDDEVVTLIMQANIIDKLLGIVSSNEDGGVLTAVYSLLARLTCVSIAVVSRIMVPAFLSKSLSLISPVTDALTLQVLNVLYHSALAGDDFCRFEVGSDVTAHLLRYLLACQPSSVGRNDRSCCGRLELEEGRKQTISTSLLLLTTLIKVSFPRTLKETVVAACVPYFLSSDRHIQLLVLKYARHSTQAADICADSQELPPYIQAAWFIHVSFENIP